MAKKTKPRLDPEWDPVIRSNYANACLSYGDWLYLADDLLECATILENRVEESFKRLRVRSSGVPAKLISHGPSAVHLMLMAYAVENLFKAALVRTNRSKYASDFEVERLPDELKSHNLMTLAKAAGIKIDLEVEDLLRRLEQCAVWRGRYPVPLTYEDFRGSARFSDGKQYSVSWFGGDDIERLKRLVQTIRNELNLHTLRAKKAFWINPPATCMKGYLAKLAKERQRGTRWRFACAKSDTSER